jgi:hypothetical protein
MPYPGGVPQLLVASKNELYGKEPDMPNYCANFLTVTGPRDSVDAFSLHAEFEDSLLSFQRFCPEPDFGAIGGREAWYDWRVLHWGTKWDADEVRCDRKDDTCVEYDFLTAWSPPIGAIQSAAAQWPALTFRLHYAEGGADFAGMTVLQGDDCLTEREGDFSDIVDEDGDWTGSLHQACEALHETSSYRAAEQLRGRVDADLVELVRRREDTLGIILRLNNYRVSRDYVEHPATTVDDLWRLGAAVLQRGHGSAPLKALSACTSHEKASIGRLLSVLGSIVRPPELLETETNADPRNVDELRRLETWFTRSLEKGISHEWVDFVLSLSSGWSGSETDDLYNAAWLLCTQ